MTFKTIVKMKTGGSVSKAAAEYTKRDRKEVGADIAQDKKIVKKAIAIHDKQEHPGEKTDLSKLKKGGRAKKAVGTVKKYCSGSGVKSYKTGGEVTNVYEAKKSSGDKDNIKKVKQQVPAKLCGGKSVRKYEDGGSVLAAVGAVPVVGPTLKRAATRLRNNVMGTPEQNAASQANLDKYAAAKAAEEAAKAGAAAAPSAPVAKKRGGKC